MSVTTTTVEPQDNKALLSRFKLRGNKRLIMILWGLALAQLAAPIGSAIYFLFTQVAYKTTYGGTTRTWFYLKDTYDRLPVHVSNLIGANWFHSQTAPAWWVVARHDFRHVLIGVIVALLVSAVTISVKPRERATKLHMILSVPYAFLVATVVAAPLIYASTFLPHLGLVQTNPWLADWIGKGTIQLTLIGIISGFAAKKIALARTMDTIQLISLEKHLTENETPQWWWKLVYPPNYRARYEYLVADRHESQPHGKLMGLVMAVSAPIVLFWLGFGVWLLYFGPAVNALK